MPREMWRAGQEPLEPDDPLWSDPRVIATPHVAGVTEVSYRNMATILAGGCPAVLSRYSVVGPVALRGLCTLVTWNGKLCSALWPLPRKYSNLPLHFRILLLLAGAHDTFHFQWVWLLLWQESC